MLNKHWAKVVFMDYKLSFQQGLICSNYFLLFKINWLLEKLKVVKMGSCGNSSNETIQEPCLKDQRQEASK